MTSVQIVVIVALVIGLVMWLVAEWLSTHYRREYASYSKKNTSTCKSTQQENGMSRNKKVLLKMMYETGQKLMSWSIVLSLLAYVTDGKLLPADTWMALLPLAVVAGIGWYWAAGQLQD